MAVTDDEQIHQLYGRLMRAWTDGDARAYAECFTSDADYVAFDGTHFTGKTAIVDHLDELFRGVLAGSALIGDVESVRLIRPDVSIVHATGSVLMPWRKSLPRRRRSRQTLVAGRTPDGWRFEAFQNSRVRPVRVPSPDSFPSRAAHGLARLARLAGRGHRATGGEPAG